MERKQIAGHLQIENENSKTCILQKWLGLAEQIVL